MWETDWDFTNIVKTVENQFFFSSKKSTMKSGPYDSHAAAFETVCKGDIVEC